MSTSHPILNWFRLRPWAVYALIFVALLLVHLVIFREVVFAIPEILRGEAVVVRDELIPFFDFNTQFWPESTAGLTSSEEVRVVYSFWTSWVRHYAVLPFALVILNAISAFILFYAFYRVSRYFSNNRMLLAMLVSGLAAFLIHFILLYAKFTHFYTLVFGFSLFALAISLVLEQLFFKRDLSKLNIVLVSLLVLLNPAIHYHVIFYFIFAFFLLLHCIVNVVLNRAHARFYMIRNIMYFAIVTAASLIPYAAFIFIAGGSGAADASTNIPANYWMIYYSSVALTSLFALDTAAPIDMFRYGSYFIPSPRVGTMVVLFLISSLFIARQWKVLHIGKRIFLTILASALLLSTWMAMGYTTSFSFHAVVGSIALFLIDQANIVSQLAGQAIVTFVNILRFPHRFQFMFYYIAGILLSIALLWLFDRVRKKRGAVVAVIATVVLALSPLFAARDYFMVLTSGNFAEFMHPYKVSPDLKQIRSQLSGTQDNLVFIMPSLESGRDIHSEGKAYNFIDKFLIYYLNQPTLYYGTGGNPEHKVISYAVYRAIEDSQPWWDEVLVNSLGITHILQPKQTSERPVGLSYMPGIDRAIAERLGESQLFRKTFDGQDFALYEANPQQSDKNTLMDMHWRDLTEYLTNNSVEGRLYFPMQLSEFTAAGNTTLRTDSVERSYYDLYVARHRAETFHPNMVQLTFSEQLIASSNFTVSALSMSKLNNKYDQYNYLGERMPSLLNTLTSQFIAVPAGNQGVTIDTKATQEGTYRLLIHAASKAESLVGAVNNQGVVFEKIADDRSKTQEYIDMSYYYVDVTLQEGANTIVLHNPGEEALVVESLTRMSPGDIPSDFSSPINQAGIRITPADEPQAYNVEMEAQ